MFSPVYLLRSLEMHFGNRHWATCGNDGCLEKKGKKRDSYRKKFELLGELAVVTIPQILLDIYCTYSGFKSTLSHSQLFQLARKHWKVAPPPLILADLSLRAESRCTCVLFPGLYPQGLWCTSAWVHLLAHTRRTFACIVINSICSECPWLQGYGWIVEEGRCLQYLFADPLIFRWGHFFFSPLRCFLSCTTALAQINSSLLLYCMRVYSHHREVNHLEITSNYCSAHSSST